MEGIILVDLFGIMLSLVLSVMALFCVCDLEKRIKKMFRADMRGMRECLGDHADRIEELYDKFERMENDGR